MTKKVVLSKSTTSAASVTVKKCARCVRSEASDGIRCVMTDDQACINIDRDGWKISIVGVEIDNTKEGRAYLVERFIPNAGGKEPEFLSLPTGFLGLLGEIVAEVIEFRLLLLRGNEIHFMQEDEDGGTFVSFLFLRQQICFNLR